MSRRLSDDSHFIEGAAASSSSSPQGRVHYIIRALFPHRRARPISMAGLNLSPTAADGRFVPSRRTRDDSPPAFEEERRKRRSPWNRRPSPIPGSGHGQKKEAQENLRLECIRRREAPRRMQHSDSKNRNLKRTCPKKNRFIAAPVEIDRAPRRSSPARRRHRSPSRGAARPPTIP